MSAVPPGLTNTAFSGSSAPGANPLSLGAVTFYTEECPSRAPIGGIEQMLAVKNLVGGSISSQSLGPKPKPITWSGTFFAENVAPRVEQLRAYASSGQEVLVSWTSERYYCKVKDFQPNYLNEWLCDYEITLDITGDANGAFASASALSIDQQVAGLQSQLSIQNANVMSIDNTGSQAYQSYLSTVNTLISNASPLSQSTPAASTSIVAAINQAIGAIQTYQGTISGLSPQYASTISMIGSLTAIAGNVAIGQAPRTVETQGGNLFNIASMQYGDVSKAFTIAIANGLKSPFLPANIIRPIVIPQGSS